MNKMLPLSWHAFPHLDVTMGTQERRVNNIGGFLMNEFPGKTANVMLNSIRILAAMDTDMSWTALQDGKWDWVFREEFTKRHRIKNEKTTIEEVNEMIEELGVISEFGYDDKEKMGESDYKELIRKWFKKLDT